MGRIRWVGVFGVVLLAGGLFARQTSARPPCRFSAEDLALTLEQVRIAGMLASLNDAGLYETETDGGFLATASDDASVFPRVQDPLVDPSVNCTTTTSAAGLTMVDPFTGELVVLELRRAP